MNVYKCAEGVWKQEQCCEAEEPLESTCKPCVQTRVTYKISVDKMDQRTKGEATVCSAWSKACPNSRAKGGTAGHENGAVTKPAVRDQSDGKHWNSLNPHPPTYLI